MLEEVTRFLPQWHSPKESGASAHASDPVIERKFIASPRQGDGTILITSCFRREVKDAKSWELLQGGHDSCLDVRDFMHHPWVKDGEPLGCVPDRRWSCPCETMLPRPVV